MNITYHLRGNQKVEVVNTDPDRVGAAIQNVIDQPAAYTEVRARLSGQWPVAVNHANVVRITIDLEA